MDLTCNYCSEACNARVNDFVTDVFDIFHLISKHLSLSTYLASAVMFLVIINNYSPKWR